MLRCSFILACSLVFACDRGPVNAPVEPSANSERSAAVIPLVDLDHECSEPVDPNGLFAVPNPAVARAWTVPPCDVRCDNPQQRCGICVPRSDTAEAEYARIDDQYRAFAWASFIAFLHPERPTKRPAQHGEVSAWRRWPQDQNERPDLEIDPVVPPSCGQPSAAQLDRLRTPSWVSPPDLGASIDIPPHEPLVSSVIAESPERPTIDYDVLFNDVAIEFLAGLSTPTDQTRHLLAGAPRPAWGHFTPDYPSASRRPPTAVKLVYARLPAAERQACEVGPCRFVLDPENPAFGLVAMHLTANLNSASGLWVWATFEHVDALAEFFGEDPQRPGHANECAAPGGHTRIERGPSNEAALAASQPLNEKFQTMLATMAGLEALANYQLIGVQHPQESCDEGCDNDRCRGSSALTIRPALLSSAVLEWDRQESSCVGCHSYATIWAPPVDRVRELCESVGDTVEECNMPGDVIAELTFTADQLAPRWYVHRTDEARRPPASHFFWFPSKLGASRTERGHP
jgi:hypothetical protein